MPNVLDATGLTLSPLTELVTNFTAAMQAIYGPDIVLTSDSPDGQLQGLYLQAVIDLQDLLMQIYNSFDPDNAIGVILDQRVAINGIQRQAGTYTITNITITTTQALNLAGLEQTGLPVYTVADSVGNQWKLQTSQVIAAAGTYVFAFQAATPGANITVANTITVPVTIVLGVSAINNPTGYTTLGLNEESDAVLKIRRQKSVSLSSQGFLSSLLAALLNIPGMISAFIYENNTDATDAIGIPSHSIWIITSGTAPDVDIATAIYRKRNAGCGMYNSGDAGAKSYPVTQADGTLFTVYWDTVVTQPAYIKFNLSSISGGVIDGAHVTALKASIVADLLPGVYQTLNINEISTLVQSINSDYLVTFPATFGLSTDGITYLNLITPTTKNGQFSLSTANISVTVV